MKEVDIRKTQFAVTDFVSWQREGSLNLNPEFQRRSVWKPDAKSYFIDTVVRGLPAPIIYLRQRVDLKNQRTVREVVDGQQRLRTVFAFIDEALIPDFDADRDRFEVKEIHNDEVAGKTFSRLRPHLQQRLLSYEFSTHVLPIDVEDRQVLEMFARLNSTGVKLNHQELRNAEYFGDFKTTVYTMAIEQLDRWRAWKVFTDDQLSRMNEVEFTSDVVLNMLSGLTGKTQARLDDIYKRYDKKFQGGQEVQRRFRQVMDSIEEVLGEEITDTVFRSQVYFFTLFVFVYDLLYGLGSDMKRRAARKLPSQLRAKLLDVSRRFETERVPRDVLDAVQRASSDTGRRKTRLDYVMKLANA